MQDKSSYAYTYTHSLCMSFGGLVDNGDAMGALFCIDAAVPIARTTIPDSPSRS